MSIDIIALTASKKYTDKQIEKASIKGVDLSGYVQSVNGQTPDENGNVDLTGVVKLPIKKDGSSDNGTIGYYAVSDGNGGVKWVSGESTNEDDPIGKASGLIVSVKDAADKKPLSFKVYGRTIQDGTPSVENPIVPSNPGNLRVYTHGKNLIDVPDITFTTGGTTEKAIASQALVPGYIYTLSATLTKANVKTGTASLRVYDRNNGQIAGINQTVLGDGKLSLTFTCPDNFKSMYIMFLYGTEGDTITFTEIQLELGDKATEYEAPAISQINCWNTINKWHGIPVETGGNYTDENGQQYICDVFDFTNNVYEQHCGYIESYSGETIPGVYVSSTGALTTGATVVYALDNPVTSTIPNPGMTEYNSWVMNSPNLTICTQYKTWIYIEYERLAEIVEEPVEAEKDFDPRHYGMTILWLEGDTTGMNKDNAVDLQYRYKDREGTASVKWQGSSSIAFPKKNYTIKFDTAFELVEGWGEQKKYCFKANYIDHSHARNICCAKLWGQIVKRRSTVPTQFANLVNGGAIDGIPCAIMLNGKFHGLYTWNIPKDGWLMGMGDGDREAIICAEGTTDAKGFKSTITELDTEYSYEYSKDENDTGWIVESVNRLIQACIDSDGTDLDTTIAQYLDWDSAIDSYIFTNLISGHDNIIRNYLLCTFDGVKWYFSQYDMDETFGQVGSGAAFRTFYARPTFTSSANEHRVYELIKLYKMDAVKARYEQLRNSVMSELNVCGTFANFIKDIPPHALLADIEKYPTIPSAAMSNYAQIAHYYGLRVKECDKEIESL